MDYYEVKVNRAGDWKTIGVFIEQLEITAEYGVDPQDRRNYALLKNWGSLKGHYQDFAEAYQEIPPNYYSVMDPIWGKDAMDSPHASRNDLGEPITIVSYTGVFEEAGDRVEYNYYEYIPDEEEPDSDEENTLYRLWHNGRCLEDFIDFQKAYANIDTWNWLRPTDEFWNTVKGIKDVDQIDHYFLEEIGEESGKQYDGVEFWYASVWASLKKGYVKSVDRDAYLYHNGEKVTGPISFREADEQVPKGFFQEVDLAKFLDFEMYGMEQTRSTATDEYYEIRWVLRTEQGEQEEDAICYRYFKYEK